jgi:Skp family chaperone for outer membrane proteins
MNRREFVLSGAGLAAAEPQDPTGFRLGVVDLRACFDANRYARVKEVAVDLAALRDRYATEIQKLRKELAEHNDALAGLPPNGELYVDKVRKAGHAEYDIKVLQEVSRRRARDLAKELQSRVYAEILRATRIVGDRLKLDLVVKEGEPKLAEDDAEGLAILTREVLHHRNAVDITAAVLDQLNTDWAAAWSCETCKRKVAPPACPDCGARRP